MAWGRERGTLIVSDECYVELGWDAEPISVLHPDVCGDSHEGLLAVHSLSKRSNLAGYRAAFVAGDPAVIGRLLEVRKHAGMIVPAPVQAAMSAALADDEHVQQQRERYARRREILRAAFERAGFTFEHSEAGLYLWGDPRRGLLDHRGCAGRVRDLGRAGRVLRTGRRAARPDRADRDGRAGGRLAGGASSADPSVLAGDGRSPPCDSQFSGVCAGHDARGGGRCRPSGRRGLCWDSTCGGSSTCCSCRPSLGVAIAVLDLRCAGRRVFGEHYGPPLILIAFELALSLAAVLLAIAIRGGQRTALRPLVLLELGWIGAAVWAVMSGGGAAVAGAVIAAADPAAGGQRRAPGPRRARWRRTTSR